MWDIHHELVLLQQSRNCFRYLPDNKFKGGILGWTTSPTWTQQLNKKIPNITFVHTHSQNTNVTPRIAFQNAQCNMCKYPLQQHKHKDRFSLPKCPVLHVYMPYTATYTQAQNLISKFSSLTCLHTLYNKTNMNTKACF